MRFAISSITCAAWVWTYLLGGFNAILWLWAASITVIACFALLRPRD